MIELLVGTRYVKPPARRGSLLAAVETALPGLRIPRAAIGELGTDFGEAEPDPEIRPWQRKSRWRGNWRASTGTPTIYPDR